jgi:hypothetical protein
MGSDQKVPVTMNPQQIYHPNQIYYPNQLRPTSSQILKRRRQQQQQQQSTNNDDNDTQDVFDVQLMDVPYTDTTTQ